MKKITLFLFAALCMFALGSCNDPGTSVTPNAMSGRTFVLDIKNSQTQQHLHYLVVKFDDNSRGTYYKTAKNWDEPEGKVDTFSYVIDNDENTHVTYTCDAYAYYEGVRYQVVESEFKPGGFTLTYQYLADGNWYLRIDDGFKEY